VSSMNGRIGIVTGGARGIGAATSRLLAVDGAGVAVFGLADDRARAEHVRAGLDGAASRISFYEADVGDPAACRQAVEAVLTDHGRIDFLVNNAGITADRTVRNMSVDEWLAVLRVNLSGPFYMIKSVIEHMIERGYGRIVNLGSIVGHTGNFGQANYVSAKAGLVGLTKTVALEVAGHGITVNCVAPGFTDTELVSAMPERARAAAIARTPERRLGKPEEIARVIRFLLDDNSSFITGAVYDVNGGGFM